MNCEDCKFAQSIVDPFTLKRRFICGKGNEIIDKYGDSWLMSDIIGGGCENGERR